LFELLKASFRAVWKKEANLPLQVTATRIDGLYKLKIKKKLKFSTKKLAKNEKKMTKKWSKKSKTYGKRKTGKFWDTLSNC